MKVYKFLIVILLSSLIFFLMSCNREDDKSVIVTKEITKDNFHSINLKSFGNVSVSYSTETKLVYKGSEVLFEKLDIEIKNGVLVIDTKDSQSENLDVSFIITMPKILKVDINGNGEVELNDFDQKDNLELKIGGNGDIKVNSFSNVKEINIDVSGNSEIEMLSECKNLQKVNIEVSGNIDYEAYLLKTPEYLIDISGNGDLKIWVERSLTVSNTGNGNIFYKGNPTIKSDNSGIMSIVEQN